MAALLAALGEGEAKRIRTRRVATLGVSAFVVAGGAGAWQLDLAREQQACIAAGDRIDEVWNARARDELERGLLATGLAYAPAVAEKVAPWLDRQAEAWRSARREACTATNAGTWDALTHDKAMWCLDDRRLELDNLVERLKDSDERAVTRAVQMAVKLKSVDPCVDELGLRSMVDPPDPKLRDAVEEARTSLRQARYSLAVAQFDDGLREVEAAREQAEAIGWSPLVNEVAVTEARLRQERGDTEGAEAMFVETFTRAAEHDQWDVAFEASMKLSYLTGHRLRRPDDGKLWGELARVAIAHAGDPTGVRENSRLQVLATVHQDAGEIDESLEMNERALANMEETLGPGHPALANPLHAIANNLSQLGKTQKARELFDRSLQINIESLGKWHPNVGHSLNGLGATYYASGDFDEALALWERAAEVYEHSYGPDHALPAMVLTNIGAIHLGARRFDDAEAVLERGLAIQEKVLPADHADIASTLERLGLVHMARSENRESEELFRRSLGMQEKNLGPENPGIASTLDNLGEAAFRLGKHDEALSHFGRAIAIRETALGPDHPQIGTSLTGMARPLLTLERPDEAILALERAVKLRSGEGVNPTALAETQFRLAQALRDSARDPARARELAESARQIYVDAGDGFQDSVGEIEDWLTER
jgi:tetratricopeptide (TPR) repeat protein